MALLVSGCASSLDAPGPLVPGELHVGPRDRAQARSARALAARAETPLDDLRAGVAAAWAYVRGNTRLGPLAERHLARAHSELPPGDPSRRDAARVLGRLLNARASVLDLSRVELQRELYAELAQDGGPDAFAFSCFERAARALGHEARGQRVRAYGQVLRLERRLRRRLRRDPDDLATLTMSANYAVTFAGAIPVGRRVRLRRAVEQLATQQARWSELPAHARDESVAPNVRVVFAFWLAEAAAAAGDRDEAARGYARVRDLSSVPDTTARRQLAARAAERLHNLDSYLGETALLPLWPAGQASCLACHTEDTPIPERDLFVRSAAGTTDPLARRSSP